MRPTLIVTAALLVFGACFGGETSPPLLAPAQTATPEGSLAGAAVGLDEPPAAIASAGSASASMGLGSYCWRSAGASDGLCADAVGIITGATALRVDRGEAVTIGGQFVQTDFAVESARIRPVEGEPAYEGEDWLAWTPAAQGPAAQDWPSEWSVLELDAVDEGLRFTAELPAGRYLVSLFVTFPQGSAGYGLILDVQ